jgi:uncharacterized membrane protein
MGDIEKEKDNSGIHDKHDLTPNDRPDTSDTRNIKDKIVGKMTAIAKPEEDNLSLAAKISNNIRAILLSLFALIGFIVLVFAIFTASVNVELAQIATSVFMAAFIAAIVGAFTLFGVVVYQIRGDNRVK